MMGILEKNPKLGVEMGFKFDLSGVGFLLQEGTRILHQGEEPKEMNKKSVSVDIVLARKLLSSANYFITKNNLEESKKYLEAALVACQVSLNSISNLENKKAGA